jgi:protein TonB
MKRLAGLNGWHVAGPSSQESPSSRAPRSLVPSSRSPRSQAAPSSRVPRWLKPPKDPLARVFDLGGDNAMRVMAGAFVLTLAGHGLAALRTAYIHAELIAWTMRLDAVIDRDMTQEVDIETMRAPEKPLPPPPKEIEPEPTKPVEVKQAAPAPAAQAAQVLAANPDDKVMDFGDNVFVVGNSQRYAGGATMSKGTNDKPPQGPRVAPTGTGNGAPPPQVMAVDLSRTAELAGSGEWRCPFPPEADADQVDDGSAVIEVVVGAGGRATRATILQDGGHGFGREARACALRESYVPALDRQGRAVASSKKFRVKFER